MASARPKGTFTELLTAKCRLCSDDVGGPVLSFGRVPIGNRFSAAPGDAICVDLKMAGCERCGLVQLVDPPAPDVLVPKVDWIRYREPEGHLDDLVEKLTALLPQGRSAAGVGPFEGPLLRRLQDRGWATKDIVLVDLADQRAGHFPYLETWQARLTSGHFLGSVGIAGHDLVTCRYLLEHSSDPLAALSHLGALLAPGGLLLLEVPDSAGFLARRDYCFPWEEHSCYFVEETLVSLGRQAGFSASAFLRYAGQLEDALVLVLKKAAPEAPPVNPPAIFHAYAEDFARRRDMVRSRLRELAEGEPRKVALFGMGHQAIMFANVMGLQDFIGVAVDDEPNKLGLYPPGLAVPITSSAALLENAEVTTCLLAVSPLSEPKVRQRLAPLVARGVRFFSIFSGVPGSISAEP